MKGHIRNIYPGGNTPEGFYSYYNYILPQRKAEKIFCLKGGPGVGKSTFMKEIGKYFSEKGEDVDLLWCSSDADSLDGVVLKSRRAALVDGTKPHIVDPVNPAAVDKIVDLGRCWDEEGIRQHRKEIIELGEKISAAFNITYGYLKIAGAEQSFMAEILDNVITDEQLYDVRRQLDMKLGSITALKRAESKMMRENAMGMAPKPGKFVKFFAGALTPDGMKNGLESLTENLERLVIIHVPDGFRSENILDAAAKRIADAGFDGELYYCPMRPVDKLEHIIVPEGRFGIVSFNSYHRLESVLMNKRVMFIDVALEYKEDDEYREIIKALDESSRENIDKAIGFLKKAKRYHDALEDFYIANMDFEAVTEIRRQIISEIERI